ncbi:MAG: hypothetical protein GY810_07430 [Aureispira sp.]|nr:hypothetical protein [Aureispira sp.]
MPFNSKLKKDSYHAEGADKAAKKVDLTKIKAEAKNAAKKLKSTTEPGTKLPFFVKKDYFKDAKGKVAGHFLALGISNLEKEFKKEKTSPEVSYGNFFIKEVNGKETGHFEFVNGQGKMKKPADWKPLLKEFKKAIKMACVFVLDGQTIEDDSKDDDTATDDSTATGTVNLDGLIKKATEIKQAIAAKKITKDVIATAKKWVDKFKVAAADATPELKKDAQLINKLVEKVAAREQGGAPKGDDKATKQLDDLQAQIDDLIKNLGGASELKKMAGL